MDLPTWHLIWCTFLVSIMIIMPTQYLGYVVNTPHAILEGFENSSYFHQFHSRLNSYSESALWGFTISCSGIGTFTASFALPYLMGRFGSKNVTFLFGGSSTIFGSTLALVSKYIQSFELFIIALLVGIGCSWSFTLGAGPSYLSECSPPKFRGMTGMSVMFSTTLGTLLAYAVGLPTLLGTNDLWQYLVFLPAIPCFIGMIVGQFTNDSPKRIYIRTRDEDLTKISILKFYGPSVNTNSVIKQFEEEVKLAQEQVGLIEVFRAYALWQAVKMSTLLGCLHLLVSGGIMIYSTAMYQALNLSNYEAQLYTVYMAIPVPIIIFLTSFFVDRTGRRPILLGGTLGMMITLVIYLVVDLLIKYRHVAAMWPKYLGFVCLCLNQWIGAAPLGVTYFMFAEMVPNRAVGASAMAFAGTTSLVFMAIIWLYPVLAAVSSFLPILLISLIPSTILLVYLWIKLPETKNLPVNEVAMLFVRKSSLKSKTGKTDANDEC